jgi:hypothetical protein
MTNLRKACMYLLTILVSLQVKRIMNLRFWTAKAEKLSSPDAFVTETIELNTFNLNSFFQEIIPLILNFSLLLVLIKVIPRKKQFNLIVPTLFAIVVSFLIHPQDLDWYLGWYFTPFLGFYFSIFIINLIIVKNLSGFAETSLLFVSLIVYHFLSQLGSSLVMIKHGVSWGIPYNLTDFVILLILLTITISYFFIQRKTASQKPLTI